MLDWTPVWDFLDKLADVLGIVSFIIAIPTLVNTHKAKSAIIEYVVEIDKIIYNIKQIAERINSSKTADEQDLKAIYNALEELHIFYGPIVKKFKDKIFDSQELIKSMLLDGYSNSYHNKTRLILLLSQITTRLEKMKKVKREELSNKDINKHKNEHT